MLEKTKEKPSFFHNLKLEFKKIIFPNRKDVVKQTVLILCTIVVLGVLIKLFDTGFGALLNLFV